LYAWRKCPLFSPACPLHQGSQERKADNSWNPAEGALVGTAADQSVLSREKVILFVERSLNEFNLSIAAVVHLSVQQLLRRITKLDHAEHSLSGY
jgi:hypothetical protein